MPDSRLPDRLRERALYLHSYHHHSGTVVCHYLRNTFKPKTSPRHCRQSDGPRLAVRDRHGHAAGAGHQRLCQDFHLLAHGEPGRGRSGVHRVSAERERGGFLPHLHLLREDVSVDPGVQQRRESGYA